MKGNVTKNEIDRFIEGLTTSNPVCLVLDDKLKLYHFGDIWKKIIPSINYDFFNNYFKMDNNSGTPDLKDVLKKTILNNQILFFNSLDNTTRFKASIIEKYQLFILLVQPVINHNYGLRNYSLEISDFLAHEYIAEYLFLKQSVDKSLSDSRKLIEKVKIKNKELESVKNELSETNTNLEIKVLEETQKNIELHQTFILNEKLTTIGELSAGIAHDLNTPLASLTVGLEGIEFIFKNIQKTRHFLKIDEITDIYEFSLSRKLDLYPSRLDKEERAKLTEIVTTKGGLPTEAASQLVSLFHQNQIKSHEDEVISKFINYSSPRDSLKLLHHYLEIRNLLKSSEIATLKATEIVSNLKNFIRNDVKQSKTKINLKDSIETVLRVFNHEIKKNIKLMIEIDSTIFVNGHKQELFQLWSNLIKNALEAMDSHEEKILDIKCFESPETITVEISNSGEKIKREDEKRIFEKFQSTKLNKSGTGLGLSIAKRIMDSHNGTITYDNSRKLTTFIAQFNKTNEK
jgi:signal transduction histidine kinase